MNHLYIYLKSLAVMPSLAFTNNSITTLSWGSSFVETLCWERLDVVDILKWVVGDDGGGVGRVITYWYSR